MPYLFVVQNQTKSLYNQVSARKIANDDATGVQTVTVQFQPIPI